MLQTVRSFQGRFSPQESPVEFVSFDDAWRLLRPFGAEVAHQSETELRLSLTEGAQSSCIDIASTDHAMAAKLPPDVIRLDRTQLADTVEAIIHKLHLTQVYLIPVGHWRQLFEAVAEGMATNEQWRAIDSAATVELNTRDALLFVPANFHILRDLIRVVLTAGTAPIHGISLATVGSPLLIEVMPAGEVVVFTGRTDLAHVVVDVLQHRTGSAKSANPNSNPNSSADSSAKPSPARRKTLGTTPKN